MNTANRTVVDAADQDQLLALLDGLPLAIAQAGAYLQESGTQLTSYIQFYEQKWSDLMESDDLTDAPLQDYPDRSVWTTWAISYQAIRNKDEATANLLLLWSFLDNKDLWFGLFTAACERSRGAEQMLSAWIEDIANSEIRFNRAMQLLRNYSLVEETIEAKSYATHPVVHQWARHSQGKCYETKLCQLAIVTVGWATPIESTRNYYVLSRRFLSHAQPCFRHIVENKVVWSGNADERSDEETDKAREQGVILQATNELGILYYGQNKLEEAELLYERVLRGKEELFGPTHISTLNTVNNLGALCYGQGKPIEAEQMYERALRGKEELLGPTHISTLETVNNLGAIYADQGKLGEAEQMYERALRGKDELLGPTHFSTLQTANNLGVFYKHQGKLGKAEQMYERALRGKEELLGPTHISTLDTVTNLGIFYADQGKPAEAEQMFKRALRGKEDLLGPTHTSTLNIVGNLGTFYFHQGKLDKAEPMYKRALRSFEDAVGTDRVEQYRPALNTVQSLGVLYEKRKEFAKARVYFVRARSGFSSILGEESNVCRRLTVSIEKMDTQLAKLEVPAAVPEGQSNLATDGNARNIVGKENEERRGLRAAEEHKRLLTEEVDPQIFAPAAEEEHQGDQGDEKKHHQIGAEENEHQTFRAKEEECERFQAEEKEPPKASKTSRLQHNKMILTYYRRVVKDC
jgi:tetratricopeptide (TPR) repeat protein